jgi:hypothetical protein
LPPTQPLATFKPIGVFASGLWPNPWDLVDILPPCYAFFRFDCLALPVQATEAADVADSLPPDFSSQMMKETPMGAVGTF